MSATVAGDGSARLESAPSVGPRAFPLEPSDSSPSCCPATISTRRGTGSRGVDFFNAATSEGRTYDDFDDLRKVKMVGFSPVQDTDHWGAALNDVSHRLVQRAVHRRLSRPALHQQPVDEPPNFDFDGDERQQVIRGNLTDPDGPLADDFIRERDTGAQRADRDATSESRTHEVRFSSPDTAERLRWAVGCRVQEEQGVLPGSRSNTRPTRVPEMNQGFAPSANRTA